MTRSRTSTAFRRTVTRSPTCNEGATSIGAQPSRGLGRRPREPADKVKGPKPRGDGPFAFGPRGVSRESGAQVLVEVDVPVVAGKDGQVPVLRDHEGDGIRDGLAEQEGRAVPVPEP